MIPLYVSQIKLAFNPGVVSCRNNHYDTLFKIFSAQSPGFQSPEFTIPCLLYTSDAADERK